MQTDVAIKMLEFKIYTQNPHLSRTKYIHKNSLNLLNPNLSTSLPNTNLSRPNSRARGSVAGRNRVIDVDQDTRVRRLVRSRERHHWSRSAITTVLNLDLRTRDIKLRTARAASRMQRNVLDPQKILAARQRLGQRERHLRLSAAGKRHLATRKGSTLRVDLEPDGTGAVEGGGGLARGDFGHVELEGARVRDGGYGREADGVTGVDGGGLGCRGTGRELVAADLL
jgi:hypothetical protein